MARGYKKSQVALPKALPGFRNIGKVTSTLEWKHKGFRTLKLLVQFKSDRNEHRGLTRMYKKNGWMEGTHLWIRTKNGFRKLTQLELTRLRARIRQSFEWDSLRGKKVYRYRLIEALRNPSARLYGLHGHHTKVNPNASHWESSLATWDTPEGIRWLTASEHERCHIDMDDFNYYRFPDKVRVGSTLENKDFQRSDGNIEEAQWETYFKEFPNVKHDFGGYLNTMKVRREREASRQKD